MGRILSLAALCLVLPFFCSCQSDEDPFADISTAKKEAPKTKKKSESSLMEKFSMERTERAKYKARLRDVSRPMDENTSQSRTFPWRTDNSFRSETLHEEMRKNGTGSTYYDW